MAACRAAVAVPGASLASVVVARGWLTPQGRAAVEAMTDAEDPEASRTSRDDARTLSMRPPDAPAQLPMPAHVAPWPIELRGRVELRELHSSGGIGEVWRAYDHLLDREIAVKRLQPAAARDEVHQARFHREARITARLEHPSIVPVYDFAPGDERNHAHYVMRFLHGQTLTETIAAVHRRRRATNAPLVGADLVTLLGYFVRVCDAIAYAHARHVIHRDLKGSNIIIGEFGEVTVLDWGLAKELDPSPAGAAIDDDDRPTIPPPLRTDATAQGHLLGTPGYMAPEQALGRNDETDERTDVYGLAAILYEILTGWPPFTGDDPQVVLLTSIVDEPVPPHELDADVPPDLEAVCLRGLAKAPAARPQRVAELTEIVGAWLAGLVERRREALARERFFNLSTDLLALVDGTGALVQVNAAWRLAPASASGGFLTALVIDDRGAAAAALDRVRAGAASAAFDARLDVPGGPPRWIDWHVTAVPGEAVLYLVGRDVSERRDAEAELQALVESAPDALCVVDAAGQIVLVNEQLERLFDYQRAALLGQPIALLVPESHRDAHAARVASYLAAPQTRPMGGRGALPGRRRDGSIVDVEIVLSAARTPRRSLVVCSLRPAAGGHRSR